MEERTALHQDSADIEDDSLGNYIGKWNEHDGNPDIKFGDPRGGKSVLFPWS